MAKDKATKKKAAKKKVSKKKAAVSKKDILKHLLPVSFLLERVRRLILENLLIFM